MAEPLIRMTSIRKSYGRVQALEDANFHVNEREIVGLLGDNGAGKSTLIKVMAGVVAPDEGRMTLDGREATFASPGAANKAGIVCIF
ncbi:ATP-binding cassette domain-containing protein, partial [Streptococcus suis]|nr:ATP-binding cassette domain-containing protein [Streptococcus suis]